MLIKQSDPIQIDGSPYYIKGIIGEGGAGVVYHAINDFGESFALKMVKNYGGDPLLKQMIDCQTKIQNAFKGEKYVINYYGQKLVGKSMFILLELGQYSLRNKIQMNHLVQDEYIQMLIDVAHGLLRIHDKKIIHRDIKPENVIYSKGLFKITDFGTSVEHQTTNQMAGTVIYWAPQLLFDQEQQYTQAVDIWSYGVLAFEAYFLIHPFFYDKSIKTNRQAISQIKRNIQAITPNFTFGKLVSHLNKLGYREKAQFIENKLQQTHESLINLFRGFFVRKPSNRLEISILLATLESIQQDQLTRVQVRTSRLLQKQLPPDIDFFVKALNLFYKLNHDYLYKRHEAVEYHLEIGLRLLAVTEYKKKDFIDYHNKQKIIKIQQKDNRLYNQIKDVLSQYYFYLKQTKQIQFFQELATLRTLICLCSCWNVISQRIRPFLKKIQIITNIAVRSIQQFQQIIPAFTERQLASIQNFILSDYFC